jgi:hypothetical protein
LLLVGFGCFRPEFRHKTSTVLAESSPKMHFLRVRGLTAKHNDKVGHSAKKASQPIIIFRKMFKG